MEAYLPLILSAVGGIVLGPSVSKILGGSGTGGILGGIVGGIAAHYGADAAGISNLLGDAGIMAMLGNVLEGGVGGGILGAVLGLVMKSR